MLWFDFLFFGNGFGLKSPYFDDKFFWLSGRFYHFSHGLGAQLCSFQWRHPKPGERRRLCDQEFVAFSSSRRGLRVRVSWAMVGLPDNLDAAHKAIRDLKERLCEL